MPLSKKGQAMNSIKESVSANFMDALKVAHMLTVRALSDLDDKIAEGGISPEAALKLRGDVIRLASEKPIEKFLIPRVFDKLSSYLMESLQQYKKDNGLKFCSNPSALKRLVSVDSTKTAAVRFDIGAKLTVLSAVPVVIFGKRADLDKVASYLIDRTQSSLLSCLHLSIKSLYKKTNKYYKKLRPEEWNDKLRNREDLAKFITDTGKYRPVEVLIVDELSHGVCSDDSAVECNKLRDALHCLKKCKLNTEYRGVCAVTMCSTDDFIGERSPETMNSFYSISRVLECTSDGSEVHLFNTTKQEVLTIKE